MIKFLVQNNKKILCGKLKPKKPVIDIKRIDEAIHDFYQSFGIRLEPGEMALTGEYYGFLGYNTYYVRYGYKGRQYTRVFASDIETAKINLTENQRKSLFSIEKINI